MKLFKWNDLNEMILINDFTGGEGHTGLSEALGDT